jgi:hypothetical protein
MAPGAGEADAAFASRIASAATPANRKSKILEKNRQAPKRMYL